MRSGIALGSIPNSHELRDRAPWALRHWLLLVSCSSIISEKTLASVQPYGMARAMMAANGEVPSAVMKRSAQRSS